MRCMRAILAAFWSVLLIANRAVGGTISPMEPISSSDSVLIVAPHPDDESLCCAGLIQAARQAGAKVAIVWITNGDAFRWDAMVIYRAALPAAATYQRLARLRVDEARSAAATLGVDTGSLYFLGYPDRGVLPLMSSHFLAQAPWRSSFTGARTVIYSDAFEPGATYDGESLARNFEAVLERVRPTLVFAPSVLDTHPDHHGAGLLVERVLAGRGDIGMLRSWIVHGGHGWPYRRRGQDVPQSIAPRGSSLAWQALSLTEESIATKRRAIAAHRTQTLVMGGVMRGYVRSTELFAKVSLATTPAAR
jgi:LmbE family N-acetylglucosaminyl deacetylase